MNDWWSNFPNRRVGDLSPIFAAPPEADLAAEIRRRAADADATRRLAELECPADLLEWGRNHNIPAFAEMTWCAGFIAGWRAFKTWSDAREAADAMQKSDL